MKSITIPAQLDNYPLKAYLWESSLPRAFVIIHSANSVDQRYYKYFAKWLSEEGFHVLTFDYRGIAASRPLKMRGFKATYEDWAIKDCEGVLTWVQTHYPKLEICLVGHSIGGVLLGLMPGNHAFSSIITVASQTAYYKDWAKAYRWKLYALWHIFQPLLSYMVGYYPGKKLGILEDTPLGIIHEWHNRRKYPDFKLQVENKLRRKSYFEKIKSPFLSIGLEDDPIGTYPALVRLHRHYSNAQLEYKMLSPATFQAQEIGHFGFFKKEMKDKLWGLILERLNKTLHTNPTISINSNEESH
jgi:predicted alpha/beta hydrolase